MDIKELKGRSITELNRLLQENREKLRDLRFKVAQKQIKNVREIRETKKTIARVLMLLKQKSREEKPQKTGERH